MEKKLSKFKDVKIQQVKMQKMETRITLAMIESQVMVLPSTERNSFLNILKHFNKGNEKKSGHSDVDILGKLLFT